MYMYCTMFKNSGKDQEIHFLHLQTKMVFNYRNKAYPFPLQVVLEIKTTVAAHWPTSPRFILVK